MKEYENDCFSKFTFNNIYICLIPSSETYIGKELNIIPFSLRSCPFIIPGSELGIN